MERAGSRVIKANLVRMADLHCLLPDRMRHGHIPCTTTLKEESPSKLCASEVAQNNCPVHFRTVRVMKGT